MLITDSVLENQLTGELVHKSVLLLIENLLLAAVYPKKYCIVMFCLLIPILTGDLLTPSSPREEERGSFVSFYRAYSSKMQNFAKQFNLACGVSEKLTNRSKKNT